MATKLAEALGCGVNDLPLSLDISWFEQKAVAVLLTLLHLGVKNIRLGPNLPAFLTPDAVDLLVNTYGIKVCMRRSGLAGRLAAARGLLLLRGLLLCGSALVAAAAAATLLPLLQRGRRPAAATGPADPRARPPPSSPALQAADTKNPFNSIEQMMAGN